LVPSKGQLAPLEADPTLLFLVLSRLEVVEVVIAPAKVQVQMGDPAVEVLSVAKVDLGCSRHQHLAALELKVEKV
jgi:hypothetical protein